MRNCFFYWFLRYFLELSGIWASVEILDFLAQFGGGFVVSFDYL